MTNYQAIKSFWEEFNLPVYEQNSVPDTAKMPYITYEVQIGGFDETVSMIGSVWYRSTKWDNAAAKMTEISNTIKTGYYQPYDNGTIFITKSEPFAQFMGDSADDAIKRVYIMLNAEFIQDE